MPTAKISSKGQTVIPKAIRKYLDLEPGDIVDFIVKDNGEVIFRPATRDVRDLKGLLRRPGQPVASVDEMNQAIRERGKQLP